MDSKETNIGPLGNLDGYRVVLASNSPRRRELLGRLGVKFEVKVPADTDESHEGIAADEVAETLARRKARAYIDTLYKEGEVVIAADTVVIADNRVLGKPKDEAEAAAMLRLLSGRSHRVITGVAVMTGDKAQSFSAVTHVEFAPLDESEIEWYVRNCRPLDKAGAYGIQEWIGCMGVSRIEGSFYNVMGLPLHRLYSVLKTL